MKFSAHLHQLNPYDRNRYTPEQIQIANSLSFGYQEVAPCDENGLAVTVRPDGIRFLHLDCIGSDDTSLLSWVVLEKLRKFSGRILITGLGLGKSLHVCPTATVVEQDARVIALHPNANVIHVDADEFLRKVKPGEFDCVYIAHTSEPYKFDKAPEVVVWHDEFTREAAKVNQ